MGAKEHAKQVVRNIRRRTRKQYSAEEKIRIVLEGLRGEESILCWLLGLEPMTRPAITGIAIAGNSVLASTTDNPFFDAPSGIRRGLRAQPTRLARGLRRQCFCNRRPGCQEADGRTMSFLDLTVGYNRHRAGLPALSPPLAHHIENTTRKRLPFPPG